MSTLSQFLASSDGRSVEQLTGTGTWTVPAGVHTVWLTGCGGGGGGASGEQNGGYDGGGGGGSGVCVADIPYPVTPGESIAYAVGAGGIGGAGIAGDGAGATHNAGSDGGNTTFGNFLLSGGRGATNQAAVSAKAQAFPVIYNNASSGRNTSGTPITADVYLSTVQTGSADGGSGGGYGASTVFGSGGDGGDGADTVTATDGSGATGNGAGGGGGGGVSGTTSGNASIVTGAGGDGSDGLLIVRW